MSFVMYTDMFIDQLFHSNRNSIDYNADKFIGNVNVFFNMLTS